MKICALLLLFVLLSDTVKSCNITLPEESITCIRCICHAITGCHSLQECSRYLFLEKDSNPDGDNCILNRIDRYVISLGDMDCNCDGRIDCDDRFGILFNNCANIRLIHMFDHRRTLYQNCMKKSMFVNYNCVNERFA